MEQASNHQRLSGARSRRGRAIFGFDWMYKSLDAVMTASLNPKEQRKDLFWSVIQKRSSNYKRVASFFNLLDSLRPGLAKGSASMLYRFGHFPLAGYQVSLLAYGSGATVFLLENDSQRKVLKVFRRSLGKPVGVAFQVAGEFREKYRALTSWFNDPYEVVVPSAHLVLHGPLLGVTAAAVIQGYIEGKKLDLFQDFTEAEIVQLGRTDPVFRLQLLDFSRRLFRVIQEQDVCFDLVGKENLLIVEIGEGYRLKIADTGVFDLPRIREQSPALYQRLEGYLQRLQAIQERLT